jgi:hypothetical protein
MVWSFSRIHLYEQCEYAFYLKYIEENEGISNFWAENGKAVHLTLEKIFKNELDLNDAPSFYMEQYENICETTKQSTMDNTFTACLDFLCEFDFEFFNDYEILGVEVECNFQIEKYKFRGFIDLLLKHKETGEIVIFDHKSSPYPFKKNGKDVLKNCQKDFEAYKHQMYLYSKYVIDKYKINPNKISWLHFKDNKIATIEFNNEDFNETLNWAVNIINKIYEDKKFLANESFMMCNRLCNFREGDCEYKLMKEEG